MLLGSATNPAKEHCWKTYPAYHITRHSVPKKHAEILQLLFHSHPRPICLQNRLLET